MPLTEPIILSRTRPAIPDSPTVRSLYDRESLESFLAFVLARDYTFNGSPLRSTNRAGIGTRGTRLVEPIAPCSLAYAVR